MFNESSEKSAKPKLTIVEEEEPSKKNRPPDLSGFTILDERWKGSSSEDSDDSLPVGSYISTGETSGRFCKSVDFRQLQRQRQLENEKVIPVVPVSVPTTPIRTKNPPIPPSNCATPMATGGSRFKIVPVETRYKRNRWACHDYYAHRDPFFTRVPKAPPTPTQPAVAAVKKEDIVNRSSRSLSDIHPVPSVSSAQKTSLQQHPPNLPKPVYIAPKVTTIAAQKTNTANVHSHTITNGSPAQVVAQTTLKNGTESLKGLEKSLTSNTEPRRTKRNPLLRAKTVVAASPPVAHHHALNIDSKIEQAMDLVKTHLMFAVREEVDGLRSKIYDLENHVHRLESENAILRRTIPNEVLQKLHVKM